MKYFSCLAIVFLFLLFSCKTASNSVKSNGIIKDFNKQKSNKSRDVIKEAKKYLGTPYKYSGVNKQGIDCSGLMYISFQKIGIELPRKSEEQANEGQYVDLEAVKPGDLLFFNTFSRGVSHTGLVEKIVNNEIFFVHSSSSKGVIISSMNETYWKSRFVTSRRFLKN